MSSQVVTYTVDDSTRVSFEIEPAPGFRPVGGAREILGRVQDAIIPAVEAAKAVLDKVKEIGPDQVELRFGLKVSGGASWLVAKAAGEGNFEITLTWDGRSEPEQPRLKPMADSDVAVVAEGSGAAVLPDDSDGRAPLAGSTDQG